MRSTKRARVIFFSFAAFFLISFSLSSPSGLSKIIWADDFDDQSLDDWIITRGAFSAELQTLWASGTEDPSSNRACHENPVTSGRWSFDILLRKDWHWRYHPPKVHFMSSSLDGNDWQGYCVDFYTILASEGDYFSVHLRKRTDYWGFLARYNYNIQADGWQHVEITRTSTGQIVVLLNGTQIIDVYDTTIESSSYFVFDAEDCAVTDIDPDTRLDMFIEARESPMIDNIVVVEYTDRNPQYYANIILLASSFAFVIVLYAGIKKRIRE